MVAREHVFLACIGTDESPLDFAYWFLSYDGDGDGECVEKQVSVCMSREVKWTARRRVARTENKRQRKK